MLNANILFWWMDHEFFLILSHIYCNIVLVHKKQQLLQPVVSHPTILRNKQQNMSSVYEPFYHFPLCCLQGIISAEWLRPPEMIHVTVSWSATSLVEVGLGLCTKATLLNLGDHGRGKRKKKRQIYETLSRPIRTVRFSNKKRTHTHTLTHFLSLHNWVCALWICFQMDWNQSMLDTLRCSVWQQAKTHHVLKMLLVWLQLLAFVVQLVTSLFFPISFPLYLCSPPQCPHSVFVFFPLVSFISKCFTGIRLLTHCQSLLSHIASLALCVCVEPQSC